MGLESFRASRNGPCNLVSALCRMSLQYRFEMADGWWYVCVVLCIGTRAARMEPEEKGAKQRGMGAKRLER